jgi:hypothetical protein
MFFGERFRIRRQGGEYFHKAEKILTPKEPKAVGLHGLIEEFDLKVPLPAVRSEVISGARKTTVTDGTILEQYPKGYLRVGVTGNLRFAMRYEPIDLSALAAVFGVLEIGEFQNWVRTDPLRCCQTLIPNS